MGDILSVGVQKPTADEPNSQVNFSRLPGATEIDRLVARSRAIGADPTLVVHGGGNTSTKTRERDHLGRERDVLRVKGSGTDLKTIGPDGFPGLFLDELLPLRDRAAMSDEEMVDYLAHCMVEPGSRRPSIETLLHAFLPARHVDHVHADAICALTNTSDPERNVREALGPDVALVPYMRPGFALSRQVGQLAGASGVVLEKHGLVTWGETHEASYERTLELVARAEAYLATREHSAPTTVPGLNDSTTEALLLTLRGLLSSDRRRVLHLDRGQRAFSDRSDVVQVATAARATPDHVLRIGARSLVVAEPDRVAEAVVEFAADYRAYFARHQQRLPAELGMLSPLPRVILVPGLGAITSGNDARSARVNVEVAARSHLVTARTLDAFGEVAWLDECDVFDFDYWPLELYKLQSAPPPRQFSGHVAVVTGADSEIGRAVAVQLAREHAHLILAGNDTVALRRLATSLPSEMAHIADADPITTSIAAFGGVDFLVALEPVMRQDHDRLRRAFEQQGLGGAIVGLQTAQKTTVDLDQPRAEGVRINIVASEENADLAQVAEAIAFLGSLRVATIDHSILHVGPASSYVWSSP